jgi:thiol-disulfide isomerase/thioredoxin
MLIKINSLLLASLNKMNVKNILALLLLLTLSVTPNISFGQKAAKKGFWNGELVLPEAATLPFKFYYNEESKEVIVINGEERILLEQLDQRGDSSVYGFTSFNSYIVFITTRKELKGYFVNNNYKAKGRVPLRAKFSKRKLTYKKTRTSNNLTGRWKATFGPLSEDEYPAIGIFEQNENGRVTGTFLTETGDYRYLAGNMNGDTFKLACFDGSHAFLFEGTFENEQLSGRFYNSYGWSTKWIAERNEEFQLTSPDELTYLLEGAELKFSKPDTTGKEYVYPNESLKGKVVIIQIMGTWCPNCLDETNYFKELYSNYHDQGLEVLGVGYEYTNTFSEQASRIQLFTEKKNVPYPILVGGNLKKDVAAADFNMLNNVTSYPTSIFINRQGEVVRIHTGFSGPGTGNIYKEYVKETNRLIERLLQE